MGSSSANLLTIDVAFDWDSKPKSGYDGFCLAGPSGFDMALAGRPAANVRGLTTADQLQFAIYDISHEVASRSVSDVVIEVRSAHDATTTGFPFERSMMGNKDGGGWYPIADLETGDLVQEANSGVYGGPYPLWPVLPSPLQLVNQGWYFFQVSFKVSQTGSKTKHFGNDPEMIVGPST